MIGNSIENSRILKPFHFKIIISFLHFQIFKFRNFQINSYSPRFAFLASFKNTSSMLAAS